MRNSIATVGDANPDTLLANPLNWRDHPQEQRDALEVALENLGWLKRVIVNRTTGRIIDGHLRVEQAKALGLATVPVVWVDLTERQEALALATLDPLSLEATTDAQKLRELLQDLGTTLNPDLDTLIADLARRQGVAAETPTPERSPPPEKVVCPRCGETW